jgi:hypothetical protein
VRARFKGKPSAFRQAGPLRLTAAVPHTLILRAEKSQSGTYFVTKANVRSAPILLQKSFWGGERKFLEPLMRFTRRREGSYRFIQNRSRTSEVALKSDASKVDCSISRVMRLNRICRLHDPIL